MQNVQNRVQDPQQEYLKYETLYPPMRQMVDYLIQEGERAGIKTEEDWATNKEIQRVVLEALENRDGQQALRYVTQNWGRKPWKRDKIGLQDQQVKIYPQEWEQQLEDAQQGGDGIIRMPYYRQYGPPTKKSVPLSQYVDLLSSFQGPIGGKFAEVYPQWAKDYIDKNISTVKDVKKFMGYNWEDKANKKFAALEKLKLASWSEADKRWVAKDDVKKKINSLSHSGTDIQNRLAKAEYLAQSAVPEYIVQQTVPAMVRAVMAANDRLSSYGFGPISNSNKGIPLYAGRWLDPVTGSIRILPSASQKYIDKTSYAAKKGYLQARLINCWNSYVSAQQALLKHSNVTPVAYKRKQAKKIQNSLNLDKQVKSANKSFKNIVLGSVFKTLPSKKQKVMNAIPNKEQFIINLRNTANDSQYNQQFKEKFQKAALDLNALYAKDKLYGSAAKYQQLAGSVGNKVQRALQRGVENEIWTRIPQFNANTKLSEIKDALDGVTKIRSEILDKYGLKMEKKQGKNRITTYDPKKLLRQKYSWQGAIPQQFKEGDDAIQNWDEYNKKKPYEKRIYFYTDQDANSFNLAKAIKDSNEQIRKALEPQKIQEEDEEDFESQEEKNILQDQQENQQKNQEKVQKIKRLGRKGLGGKRKKGKKKIKV